MHTVVSKKCRFFIFLTEKWWPFSFLLSITKWERFECSEEKKYLRRISKGIFDASQREQNSNLNNTKLIALQHIQKRCKDNKFILKMKQILASWRHVILIHSGENNLKSFKVLRYFVKLMGRKICQANIICCKAKIMLPYMCKLCQNKN